MNGIYTSWKITLIDRMFQTHEYKMEAYNREDAVSQAMNRAFKEMPQNKFGLVEIAEYKTDGQDTIIHFTR